MHVLEEASANHATISNALYEAGLEVDTADGGAARARVGKRINAENLSEFYTLGTILGDRYTDSPVVQASSLPAAPRDFLNYVPSAVPGSRAPHAWLHDGSSLFDHFGQGMTLLALPTVASACTRAALRDAAALNVPFILLPCDNPAVCALYPRRLTLVRPDQRIAWSGDTWPERDDFDVLAMATGQMPGTEALHTKELNLTQTHNKETVHESNA